MSRQPLLPPPPLLVNNIRCPLCIFYKSQSEIDTKYLRAKIVRQRSRAGVRASVRACGGFGNNFAGSQQRHFGAKF